MKNVFVSLSVWSLVFSIPFLLSELSFLLNPFSFLPMWALYLLVVVLGFSVIIAVEDFKIGFFANLEGAVIATVVYFWLARYTLSNVGDIPMVMASNAALTSIITKSATLYIFSLLGNLAGFLVSGMA